MVIGITYALFTISLTGTKTVEITTGNISLKIDNEIPEEGVILENAFPEGDDSGLNETAYEFDLINDGDADNNAMNKKFEAIAYIYGTQVLK